MNPTAEQKAAIDLFAQGESMVIEAGAGTGKTSCLEMIARATRKRGQYVAFNKSIVVEAGKRMPENVSAKTAHSLAYRAVGAKYSSRLRNSARMKSTEIAARLDIGSLSVPVGSETKVLAAGFLAGRVMGAVSAFCHSADTEPSVQHFEEITGIDMPTTDGKRTWENNNWVARKLLPKVLKAWEDVRKIDGQLPFKHDHYLKIWQLSEPRIPADFILFDEAQDADPVMAAIVAAQTHAQRIYVGDSQQAIYGWRGAVNAMAEIENADARTFLTQSFRFGQPIADAANEILEELEAELRLRGTPGLVSSVGDYALTPRAILTRSNAGAVQTVLRHIAAGTSVHLVGGGEEIARFTRGAMGLQRGERSMHPDLACFESWNEVREYVGSDPQGSDLKMMVDLIDEYGPEVILRAVDSSTPEAKARLVVSTAHKAKGREWDTVKCHSDFRTDKAGEEEWRLMYVAITRARQHLDDGGILKGLRARKAGQQTEPASPAIA